MADSSSSDGASSAAKRAKGHEIGSRDHFLAVYEELRSFIVKDVIPAYGLPAEAAQWNADMLDYNVPGTGDAWPRGRRAEAIQH